MKKFPLVLILSGVFLLVFAVVLPPANEVNAQCKTPSTCKTCHEVQNQMPVNTDGDWHIDHAIIDACVLCHGGDDKNSEKVQAHFGVESKLSDMPSKCVTCHCDDLQERYSVYAQKLNITDFSNLETASIVATPTQTSGGIGFYLGGTTADIPLPSGSNDLSTTAGKNQNVNAASKQNQTVNWILGVVLIGLVIGGGSLVVRNERQLHTSNPEKMTFTRWLWKRVRAENWSPYIAGILLGLIAIFAVVGGKHLLTASGGIALTASVLMNKIFPAAVENNMYFKYIMPPVIDWEILILIGIFLGGLLASLSSKTFRIRWNDDPTWKKVYGAARWKRFVIGFVGAIIIQYGASIAGGCTSGLAISGGMLLAPSAFLFMGGMFISGIIVAVIVFRRRY